MTQPRGVLLFDGACNLCNGFINALIERDPKGRLHFGSLQSPEGRNVLREVRCLDLATDFGTVVLITDRRVRVRSSAALGAISLLGFPWSLARLLLVIPRPLRDAVYDWVARHRYRWFGYREICRMPTPELRERFLSDSMVD